MAQSQLVRYLMAVKCTEYPYHRFVHSGRIFLLRVKTGANGEESDDNLVSQK